MLVISKAVELILLFLFAAFITPFSFFKFTTMPITCELQTVKHPNGCDADASEENAR